MEKEKTVGVVALGIGLGIYFLTSENSYVADFICGLFIGIGLYNIFGKKPVYRIKKKLDLLKNHNKDGSDIEKLE